MIIIISIFVIIVVITPRLLFLFEDSISALWKLNPDIEKYKNTLDDYKKGAKKVLINKAIEDSETRPEVKFTVLSIAVTKSVDPPVNTPAVVEAVEQLLQQQRRIAAEAEELQTRQQAIKEHAAATDEFDDSEKVFREIVREF